MRITVEAFTLMACKSVGPPEAHRFRLVLYTKRKPMARHDVVCTIYTIKYVSSEKIHIYDLNLLPPPLLFKEDPFPRMLININSC
jgi:hypothetical protein